MCQHTEIALIFAFYPEKLCSNIPHNPLIWRCHGNKIYADEQPSQINILPQDLNTDTVLVKYLKLQFSLCPLVLHV